LPLSSEYVSPRLLSKRIKHENVYVTILPVVLYGCKIWSFTINERYRLRVFENTVIRKITAPKKDQIIGGQWGFQKLYALPNTAKMVKSRMRWAGDIACRGK
jgi:hypothetical protein